MPCIVLNNPDPNFALAKQTITIKIECSFAAMSSKKCAIEDNALKKKKLTKSKDRIDRPKVSEFHVMSDL